MLSSVVLYCIVQCSPLLSCIVQCYLVLSSVISSPSSRSRRGEQLERLSGVLKKHGLDCGALRGNKVIFQSHAGDLGFEQSDVQVLVTAVTLDIAVKLGETDSRNCSD